MHLLRILLAGDGSGNSDIGGDEFCIIFRFGGDSEMVMTAAGGIGRFAVTVVAAMVRYRRSSSNFLFFGGLRTLNCKTRYARRRSDYV